MTQWKSKLTLTILMATHSTSSSLLWERHGSIRQQCLTKRLLVVVVSIRSPCPHSLEIPESLKIDNSLSYDISKSWRCHPLPFRAGSASLSLSWSLCGLPCKDCLLRPYRRASVAGASSSPVMVRVQAPAIIRRRRRR